MAHFAEIDTNNVVIRVLTVPDDQESRGQDFLANDLGLGGIWIKTSYNTRLGAHVNGGIPFRKNYAGVGYTYDSIRDAFLPPKEFASWILNEETCWWEPPFPPPTDNLHYVWNEEIQNWDTPRPGVSPEIAILGD